MQEPTFLSQTPHTSSLHRRIIAPQARRAIVVRFSIKKRVKSGDNHYCVGRKSASASAKNAEAFSAKARRLSKKA
jgi:hypothetical protein